MGVHTTYDDMRDSLREKLTQCLSEARELLDEDTWGFDEMKDGYALEVYLAVKKARDIV